jgi:Spy/CpxP family protein refolding chaperone
VHEETRTRLQSILTPEQMTQLDELHQHYRHKQPGGGTDNGNAAP